MSRKPLSLTDLHRAVDLPDLPLIMELPGTTRRTVRLDAWLRVLPGRRWVAQACYLGNPVLLKLFAGARAPRRQHREFQGVERLRGTGIPTAGVIAADNAIEGGFILFDWLPKASPVLVDDVDRMCQVAKLLGQLHCAGITQSDLHLGNFLVSEDQVFAVDGDGVRRFRQLPGRAISHALNELAILAAQRPPHCDDQLALLLQAYGNGRAWSPQLSQVQALEPRLVRAVYHQRRKRMRRYLGKTERACTEFLHQREPGRQILALRDRFDSIVAGIARQPELYLAQGKVIKAGNSATVVRIAIKADATESVPSADRVRSFVLKRYNIKSLAHRLRISLKIRSRGRIAWRNGQLLNFLDIPTARPLMLVEYRRGLLREHAYLLMEDLGDLDLASAVAAQGSRSVWCDAVARQFDALMRAGLVHGDTKATNFLVRDDAIFLVDLDALAATGPHRPIDRDHQRFLANWVEGSTAHARFSQALASLDSR